MNHNDATLFYLGGAEGAEKRVEPRRRNVATFFTAEELRQKRKGGTITARLRNGSVKCAITTDLPAGDRGTETRSDPVERRHSRALPSIPDSLFVKMDPRLDIGAECCHVIREGAVVSCRCWTT